MSEQLAQKSGTQISLPAGCPLE